MEPLNQPQPKSQIGTIIAIIVVLIIIVIGALYIFGGEKEEVVPTTTTQQTSPNDDKSIENLEAEINAASLEDLSTENL